MTGAGSSDLLEGKEVRGKQTRAKHTLDMAEQAKQLASSKRGMGTNSRKLPSRLTARLIAVLMLGISIAALVERSGSVEWLFAAAAGAAVVVGMILPYAAVGRLTVERTVHDSRGLVDGGAMHVQLTLKLSRRLPFMWITVHEHIVNASSPDGRSIRVRGALLPGFSRQIGLSYTVSGLQRGVLEFGDAQVHLGDLLGLTIRTLDANCSGRVIVNPASPVGEAAAELPRLAFSSKRHRPQLSWMNEDPVSADMRMRRDGSSPAVRGYVPGDSMRRVDWRAMARGMGMLTRTNEEEQPDTVVILIEASLDAYGEDTRLFDANAGRALVLLRQADQEGKRVILLSNSLDMAELHAGARGSAAKRDAAIRLASMRLGAGKPMSERLSDVVAAAPHGASVICLAPGNADGAAAIARASGEPGNVFYGAKLAGIRGVRLAFLLSTPSADCAAAEVRWKQRLQGTGVLVKAVAVSDAYRSQQPQVSAIEMRIVREGGVEDGGNASAVGSPAATD